MEDAMNNNNKKVFLDFVFTYFAIIVLVLICLFPIYTSLERAEQDKATQMIQDYGTSNLRELEAEKRRIFQTSRNFYTDQDLRRYYYSESETPDTTIFYYMSQLQKKLKLYFQNIDSIRGVFVYIPKFDYVLTQKYTFRSRSEFYHYNQFDNYPEEDWLDQLCKPEHNMTVNAGQFTDLLDTGEACPVMNLTYTFPMAGDSNIRMLIMVSLDSEAIAQQFLLPEIRQQAYAVITDKKGEILASSAHDAKNRQYQTIAIGGSAENNIEIGIDKQFYSSIRTKTLWSIAQSIGTALLAGACVALYFAWNRSRPLEHVLDIIRKSSMDKHGISRIGDLEDSVISMVSEIRQCKDTIKDLDDLARSNLLEQLFFGEYTPGKERAFIQYFGSLPPSCISVVFSCEDPAADGTALKNAVSERLSPPDSTTWFIHVHKNKVYLLLPEEPDTQDLLTLILRHLREHGYGIVKAGISNSITGLNVVKEGIRQAERRLAAGFHIQGIYLFAHTYSSRAARNLFNVQLLDILQRALLAGNRQGADKIIIDIFNYVQPEKPDAIELRQLFFTLRSVYSTVISQFSLEAEKNEEHVHDCPFLPNDLDEYSPVSIKHAFIDLNGIISDYYQKLLARTKRIKGFDIISYVEENYQDPNLCASSIAVIFNISEKYVFQLVKGACGETLNDKISFLRVQEGIRLLENTNMTVTEVALSTGFTSSNSMYKVFMRVKGVSPSAYRTKI